MARLKKKRSPFSQKDFAPGGRCWPPHPQPVTDSLFTIDLGEHGDLGEVAPLLEDLRGALLVLSGEKSVDQLRREWGLEETREVPVEVILPQKAKKVRA